jgi:hypothetical protein
VLGSLHVGSGIVAPLISRLDNTPHSWKTHIVYIPRQRNVMCVAGDGVDGKSDSLVWIQAGSVSFAADCVASWIPWSACSAECGGGLQLSTYVVTTPASGTGNRTCNTQVRPEVIGPD